MRKYTKKDLGGSKRLLNFLIPLNTWSHDLEKLKTLFIGNIIRNKFTLNKHISIIEDNPSLLNLFENIKIGSNKLLYKPLTHP